MSLVSLTNAQCAFGHVALLDHVEFSVQAGERIGLIGRNGVGKSSFIKILAGRIPLDDGLRVIQQHLTIAYVDQAPEFKGEQTVFDAVASGLGTVSLLLREYEILTQQCAKPSDDHDILLARMQDIQFAIEATDGWTLSNRVDAVIHRFGLKKEAFVSTLSGGTQKRVALARALVSAPNLLLLDEPTNHLDITSIVCLENILIDFRGSIIFITHDRHFLDQCATRIVELDRGQLYSFPGNFATYQTRKAELLQHEIVINAKFDKHMAQEEIWIRQGVQARCTRNEGRVRRLQALRQAREQRRIPSGQVKLQLSSGKLSGKMVAELTHVSKAYGDQQVVKDFSAILCRGDKIGLIGPNGVGKTTLLRLILGELQPDQGHVRLGKNLQIAYFDQMRVQLGDDDRLIDTICPGSEWIEINGQRQHVMSYLKDFLFSPERARSPVKSLSGGERNRLLLARLFAKPANVLVLDEPTNDLDIDTLELLETLLENYDGTVFVVSHDRTFLDNVVTQVIAWQGDEQWKEYVGGYSDWQAQIQRQQVPHLPLSPVSLKNLSARQAKKFSAVHAAQAIQRERDTLQKRIEKLEVEQEQLVQQLADPALYTDGANTTMADEVRQLSQRLQDVEALLMETMHQWASL